MNDQPPPERRSPAVSATLREMIMGFRTTQLIHVAAKLGIADLLEDGPRSARHLAFSCGTDPGALYRLLRALTSLGIFAATQDGRFRLTDLARPLGSAAPDSLRGLAILYGEDWCWRAYGALRQSIATGRTAFDQVHGMGFFDYLGRDAEAAAAFHRAMTAYTRQEVAALLAAYDFSSAATVADVGGGQGALLARLLKAHPRMRGILFDLPAAVEGARRLLAEESVAERCAFIAGDFFRAVPGGADIYLLKSVIHDWDDAHARAILARCRAAMAEGARLLVVERVVPAGNQPAEAKLFDINMLVTAGGRERTAAEYRALLHAAGFALRAVVPTGCAMSVLEAVPDRATDDGRAERLGFLAQPPLEGHAQC